MEKFYLFTLSLLICFLISCDGRDRSSIPNIEVLKENKLLDSFSENTTYVPAKEVKVETDTILNNGFTIKIKNRTDSLNTISTSYTEENIKYITKYRQFITDIEVKKDNKSIFISTINKDHLIAKYKTLLKENTTLSNIIYGGASVNQNKPNNDSVILNIYLDNPITETLFIYDLIVSKNGNETFEFSKKLRYGE